VQAVTSVVGLRLDFSLQAKNPADFRPLRLNSAYQAKNSACQAEIQPIKLKLSLSI
jgi:hypothetical protein